MEVDPSPKSFGVIKPVGHIVMAYRTSSTLQSARAAAVLEH